MPLLNSKKTQKKNKQLINNNSLNSHLSFLVICPHDFYDFFSRIYMI